MLRSKKLGAGIVGMAALSVAAAGPASAGEAPAAPTKGSVTDPGLAALAEIPDTPGNRSFITVNRFTALWQSAGISGVPSFRQVAKKGPGFDATLEPLGGSRIGSDLWPLVGAYPAPLGYNVLALTEEVNVGQPASDLGEVWGPIQPSVVAAKLRPLKPTVTEVGGAPVYATMESLTTANQALVQISLGSPRFALPGAGGRIVASAAGVPEASFADLVAGKPVAHSLASDPAVAQVMAVLPANPTVLAMGTQYLGSPRMALGNKATPQKVEKALKRSGLQLAPVDPMFFGLAYSGSTTNVTAAALYPNAADANAALPVVSHDLRAGKSLTTHSPYSKRWQVTAAAVQGDVVVVHLSARGPGAVSRALFSGDFPLFWKQ